MTLLRGYIVMAVFRGVALALTVIVTIYASIDLVSQLHDLGTGGYGFPQLLSYVLLRLPRKVFDTLPAAAIACTHQRPIHSGVTPRSSQTRAIDNTFA